MVNTILEVIMEENSKNKNAGSKDECCDSVKDINQKNEKNPAQANEGKEDQSYEEQTLMDGVGSSLEEMERIKCDDKNKKSK
jgi:hypothetical protein